LGRFYTVQIRLARKHRLALIAFENQITDWSAYLFENGVQVTQSVSVFVARPFASQKHANVCNPKSEIHNLGRAIGAPRARGV
jgi:hypothetical protein